MIMSVQEPDGVIRLCSLLSGHRPKLTVHQHGTYVRYDMCALYRNQVSTR